MSAERNAHRNLSITAAKTRRGPGRSGDAGKAVTRIDIFVLAGVCAFYLLVGAISGLSWPEFRDEPMYIGSVIATRDGLPRLTFDMNICAIGLTLWASLAEWVSDSIVVLRSSVLLVSLGCFLSWVQLEKRVPGGTLWRSLLILALVPEVFIYAYQVNGSGITLLGTIWVCTAFLVRHERGPTFPNDLLLWASLSWACVQSPFCLGFLPAVIICELLLHRDGALRIPYRTGVLAVLAFGTWILFILLNPTGLTESLERHSSGINPSMFKLHFGNWAIFFVLWGGLFPLLGFAVPDRLSFRRVVPFLLAVGALGFACLPKNGYAFDTGFHTIYTMVIDRIVQAAGLPDIVMNLGYFTLLLLGCYGFVNFARFVWYQPYGRFFLALLACYLTLMLVDGFIASRLFLPGWIGLLLYIERAFQGRRLFAIQVIYQMLVCAVYTIGLGIRWGFMGI